MFDLALQVAPSHSTILITGETGTGKGVLAKFIHANSLRRGRYVRKNCGGLTESLLESEVYGHEKHAFTGASHRRKGWFEQADGGTLLLDEIADFPFARQAALLDVLEEGVVTRVGGEAEIRVDTRVIAATNADLESLVNQGRFRRDLFARLHIHRLRLAPLRERPECVAALARRFAARLGFELTPDAVAFLQSLPLPENARELGALIERAAVSAEGPLNSERLRTTASDAREASFPTGTPVEVEDLSMKPAILKLRIDLARKAMQRTGGNQAKAARLLKISVQALHEIVHEHDLLGASGIKPA